jgi:hypothetical protein
MQQTIINWFQNQSSDEPIDVGDPLAPVQHPNVK